MAADNKGAEAPGAGTSSMPPPQQQQAATPAGYPGAPAPAQPVYYVPATYHPPPTMTIQQAISPEELKKIRKMTWINFGCTLVQLGCSMAVIIILTQNLEGTTWTNGSSFPQYYCYFSTTNSSTPCRYAYSLASVSIFWGFILSLIQCLTLDCCGMGRLFEMIFDLLASAWWVAGAITLTSYHSEAAAAGVPGNSARQGIIALCWITACVFLCLAVTNGILMKKYGKAYKNMAQQLSAAQQQMPVGQPVHVVQMGQSPAGYQPQVAPAGYQPQVAPAGYQPQMGPAGYQPQMGPAGYQPQANPSGYPMQPVPAGFNYPTATGAPGYPATPPLQGVPPPAAAPQQ